MRAGNDESSGSAHAPLKARLQPRSPRKDLCFIQADCENRRELSFARGPVDKDKAVAFHLCNRTKPVCFLLS